VDLADRSGGDGLALKSGEQGLRSSSEILPDGLLDLGERRGLGVELEHCEKLARLGGEGAVHVGQDLAHFHRDALQLAKRLDKPGECLR
jgi:hypothetical protein